MKKITSAQNPRLKNAIRLKTSRGRKTQRRIIVFGLREVQRALQTGIQPLEVFVCPPQLNEDATRDLLERCSPPATVYELPESLMTKLRYGQRNSGVVMIAARPDRSLNRLSLNVDTPLVVILESVEKPGNIGAVLRSMDGVGADVLVLTDPRCDLWHPNCIRSSMGSVFTIPVAITTNAEAVEWCRDKGLTVRATSDAASTLYTEIDFCQPTAVVFGNEADGLSATWLDSCLGSPISIPMQGISDSLNVSVAAGIILYEARRQRRKV